MIYFAGPLFTPEESVLLNGMLPAALLAVPFALFLLKRNKKKSLIVRTLIFWVPFLALTIAWVIVWSMIY